MRREVGLKRCKGHLLLSLYPPQGAYKTQLRLPKTVGKTVTKGAFQKIQIPKTHPWKLIHQI